MKYYNRADADKATAERIENLRKYAGYIPTIKKTVREFNNKIFNCRLEKALQAATGDYIRVEKRYNNITLYAYNKGDCYTLGVMSIDSMTDGKRINSDNLCDSLNEYRTKLLSEAATIEEQQKQVDVVLARLNELKKVYNHITNELNYTIIDNYGIKRYL